jgi:hypothetical protein
LIWRAAGPSINGTDSCSARCGVVEKRRSPRAGLRARRSGPHAQHAAEATRRGPASASAGAGRRGHQHDMQCTLDPGRSRDRRAVLLRVPPARTSTLASAAPVGPRTRRGCEMLHPSTARDPGGPCRSPGGAMESQRDQPPPSARHVKVAICDRCGDVSVGDAVCRCRTPYDEPAVRRRHQIAVARARARATAPDRRRRQRSNPAA